MSPAEFEAAHDDLYKRIDLELQAYSKKACAQDPTARSHYVKADELTLEARSLREEFFKSIRASKGV
jgi:hypothetical protein